jgi:hypothetical protein
MEEEGIANVIGVEIGDRLYLLLHLLTLSATMKMSTCHVLYAQRVVSTAARKSLVRRMRLS